MELVCSILRRILIAIAILVPPSFMNADGFEYGIWICKTNRKCDYVRFSDSPKITFTNNDEIIFATIAGELIYNLADVDEYKFGEVPSEGYTSVKSLEYDLSIRFHLENGIITLNNVPSRSKINIYSLNGMVVFSQTSQDTYISIDTVDFNSGVYIVTINDSQYFKFNKR